jgi:hypothetical protein
VSGSITVETYSSNPYLHQLFNQAGFFNLPKRKVNVIITVSFQEVAEGYTRNSAL